MRGALPRQKRRIWSYEASDFFENGRLLLCLEVRKSNVFEAVKQSVTTRQAAEHYGIRVNRNGMCLLPVPQR